MIIATTGPSLAELRRKIGTKETVQFGPLVMSVESLCTVGEYDVPVDMPGHRMYDSASAWYITGDRENAGIDIDFTPTTIVFATYSTAGRMTCAAIAVAYEEDLSGEVATGIVLRNNFLKVLAAEFGRLRP